jgi:hypothetical protein
MALLLGVIDSVPGTPICGFVDVTLNNRDRISDVVPGLIEDFW